MISWRPGKQRSRRLFLNLTAQVKDAKLLVKQREKELAEYIALNETTGRRSDAVRDGFAKQVEKAEAAVQDLTEVTRRYGAAAHSPETGCQGC